MKTNPHSVPKSSIANEKIHRLVLPNHYAGFILIFLWVTNFITPPHGLSQISQQPASATSEFELTDTILQDWETDIRDMMDISLETDSLPNLFPSLSAISNATISQPTKMLHLFKLSLVIGSVAGIHTSDGNLIFVRRGEVLHHPQFGYLQISNVTPLQVDIRHLFTNTSISIPLTKQDAVSLPSIPQDHNFTQYTDPIIQQPDTILFQLDTTIVPQSPILNYRFQDSLHLQNIEISLFLDLLHKITNLEFSLEAQDHQTHRPIVISVDLETPTLREVFMTALPPVGLWFEVNNHEITLFSLKSRLK